jgi:hypothetical protein
VKKQIWTLTISILQKLIRFNKVIDEVQPYGIGLFVVVESESTVITWIIKLFRYVT